MQSDICPLCHSTNTHHYHEDKKRCYRQCSHCDLVFVPKAFHLSQADEKAEYDKHENLNLDEGYRRFLNRTLEPLVSAVKLRYQAPYKGLDFGCGEGKHISLMAAEQGVEIHNYDLYYCNDEALLADKYQFIVMTEVIEHIADAKSLLVDLRNMLVPGGMLAIMTKRVRNKEVFATWHYKNDPTHICFYSEQTFEFIGDWLGFDVEVVANDVVFLLK